MPRNHNFNGTYAKKWGFLENDIRFRWGLDQSANHAICGKGGRLDSDSWLTCELYKSWHRQHDDYRKTSLWEWWNDVSNERNKFVAGLCGTLAALPLTGTMMDQSSRHLEIATWTVECPLLILAAKIKGCHWLLCFDLYFFDVRRLFRPMIAIYNYFWISNYPACAKSSCGLVDTWTPWKQDIHHDHDDNLESECQRKHKPCIASLHGPNSVVQVSTLSASDLPGGCKIGVVKAGGSRDHWFWWFWWVVSLSLSAPKRAWKWKKDGTYHIHVSEPWRHTSFLTVPCSFFRSVSFAGRMMMRWKMHVACHHRRLGNNLHLGILKPPDSWFLSLRCWCMKACRCVSKLGAPSNLFNTFHSSIKLSDWDPILRHAHVGWTADVKLESVQS